MRAAVPLAVLGGVLQAEVCTYVDYRHSGADERGAGLGAGGVRERGEGEVDAGGEVRLDRQVERARCGKTSASFLPASLRPVTLVICTSGWLYSRRASSAPAYPVTFMIPTLMAISLLQK